MICKNKQFINLLYTKNKKLQILIINKNNLNY